MAEELHLMKHPQRYHIGGGDHAGAGQQWPHGQHQPIDGKGGHLGPLTPTTPDVVEILIHGRDEQQGDHHQRHHPNGSHA